MKTKGASPTLQSYIGKNLSDLTPKALSTAEAKAVDNPGGPKTTQKSDGNNHLYETDLDAFEMKQLVLNDGNRTLILQDHNGDGRNPSHPRGGRRGAV